MPSQHSVNGGEQRDLGSGWVRSKSSSHSSMIREGGKSARRKGPNFIGRGKSITTPHRAKRLPQPDDCGSAVVGLVKHLSPAGSATLLTVTLTAPPSGMVRRELGILHAGTRPRTIDSCR